MTERLYYTDSYCREFEATVRAIEAADGRTLALLDRTAFYPTSGGQPFDTGMLGDARVVDVVDREDGGIAHVVEGGTLAAGARVAGRIDWDRRLDHMQQHTGQHVLSAAFDRLHGAETVSFHLGTVASTIDLATEVGAREVEAAERAANAVVWEDRPVHVRFEHFEHVVRGFSLVNGDMSLVNAETRLKPRTTDGLALRKRPAREGTLRLVEVEGFDLSACGGTHVARTGAIGAIAVGGWERFKGGTRVEFLCGGRALDRFRMLRDASARSLRLLSVLPPELPDAIERLQAENRDLGRAVKDLRGRLAAHAAEALAARAVPSGGAALIVERVEESDPGALRALASAIASRPGLVAAIVSTASPPALAIARSSDIAVDAAAALEALTARHGGRGGGRRELAQGGGFDATGETLVASARAILAAACEAAARTERRD
jgi:alanyl-tRNA synthetase